MSDRKVSLCYSIDGNDQIIGVTGPWNDFALNNGAASAPDRVLAANIIGQPLFTFIQDNATRMLMQTVVRAVRMLGGQRQVEYRCDSATHKRFMRMRLQLTNDGLVDISHEQLRVEPMAHAFDTRAVPDSQQHYHRCSLCNRIEFDQVWLEPDDELLESLAQPCPVFHTICPLCEQHLAD